MALSTAHVDADYRRLVLDVSSAIRAQTNVLSARLPETGRTLAQLVADVLGAITPVVDRHCEECGHARIVRNSRRKGHSVVQYLECQCGTIKRVVPGCVVPRRRRDRDD